MKFFKQKGVIYCIGFMIVISVRVFIRAGELSAFSLLNSILLISLSYVAMIFDIKTKRIPNMLVLVMAAGWLILMTVFLIFDMESGIHSVMDSIYGSLTGGGLFLLVYLISRKGLGGGDVKFMAAAGLYLGFASTIPAILYGTVIAAVTGLVLVMLKKINRKDTIPLVPFLFIGIIIAA